MVKPPPISLRIRAREITAHARRVLENDNDLAQRRVRASAARAAAAVCAMKNAAKPKLKSLHYNQRASWESTIQLLETILSRIIRRGIE
jgi:hypothetical protein